MTDILEIKNRLNDQVLQVCKYLFPNGKVEGHEFRIGDLQGSAGKSLGVHIDGNKRGIWADFATGDGGDIINLWQQSRCLQLAPALQDIKHYLGISTPEFTRPAKTIYSRPKAPKTTRLQGACLEYLSGNRKISEATIKEYRLGQLDDFIFFPFINPAGEVQLIKKRKAGDGERPIPTEKNCAAVLFGWQAIPAWSREVVITEGEIDALTWHDYGFPALSVPFGGGSGLKQKWIENEYDNLERFEKIYLSTDDDEEGHKAAEEIAKRLGRHRCYRVILPHKDANKCAQEGLDKEQIYDCILAAKSLDPEGLKRPMDYFNEVSNLFYPEEGAHIGYHLAYAGTHNLLRFRPDEVTIWTGSPGAGKSQILSDNIPAWIAQGSKICNASLEMQPKQSLRRLAKQTIGSGAPTVNAIGKALTWANEGLLLYDFVGKADIDTLLEVFSYALAKYGCDQFIIDSLMRLGVAGDDYNKQEQVMFKIVNWAMEKNVHVHLVAHAKKPEKGSYILAIEDIKGAMELGANAANILAISRNRKLEELKLANPDDEEIQSKPGVVLNIAKQRNGDFEGPKFLWFNQDCYQYRASGDSNFTTRCYIKDMEGDFENLSPFYL